MSKTRIIIVSCSDDKLWYKEHIEEEFLVEAKIKKDGKKYIVKHNGEHKWIYEDDVEIMKNVYKCIKPFMCINENKQSGLEIRKDSLWLEWENLEDSRPLNLQRIILIDDKLKKSINISRKEFEERFKFEGYGYMQPYLNHVDFLD